MAGNFSTKTDVSTPENLPMIEALAVAAPRSVEIWFDFGSPYAYLTVMRAGEVAAAHALEIIWRPFMLGPIFRELGWQSSPFLEQKEKLAYLWHEMPRLCAKYRFGWKQPSAFPRQSLLPARIAISHVDEEWCTDYCRAVIARNFAEDLEIESPQAQSQILCALRLPADAILAKATSDETKTMLRRQTERARRLGIFGAPTFVVRDQLFWGNDRLEDAMLCADESNAC